MILLDTSYIVSSLITNEENHAKALEISEKINKKELVIK